MLAWQLIMTSCFVDISHVSKEFIKIWNLLFDTLSPIGYLHLIMRLNLWFLCGWDYLSKCYEKLVVDFIYNQWPTVIFVEFIEDQKYELLL